jgi:hypothetical protein
MPTPNYQYEKRSRELAKQKKQVTKRQRKLGEPRVQPQSTPEQARESRTATNK